MDPQKNSDAPQPGGDVQDVNFNAGDAQTGASGSDTFAGSGSTVAAAPKPAGDPLFPPGGVAPRAETPTGTNPVSSQPTNLSSPSVETPAQSVDTATSGEVAPAVGSDSSQAVLAEPQVTAEAGQQQDVPAVPVAPLDIPVIPQATNQPKKHKKKLIVGLIVAVASGLLLLSGGVAAYYLTAAKPENILKQALANSLDPTKAKTVKFSGSMMAKPADEDMTLRANFEGAGDNQSGAMMLSANMDAMVTKVTMDVRSVDGKTLYLKVGGLKGLPELLAAGSGAALPDGVAAEDVQRPEMAMLGVLGPLIESLNDQWIEVSESILQDGAGVPDTGSLTDADRTKLAELYDQHTFLTVREKLADEEIKGDKSYHYKAGIDKEKLKSFVSAVKDARIESLKLEEKEVREFNELVDKADFNALGFEVWVSKDSKMIRQVAVKYEKDGDKLDVRVTIDSYNEEVKVEKPAEAKSLLELMGAFGAFMNEANIPMDGTLPTSAELPPGISL